MELKDYGIEDWPDSWHGIEEDISYGKKLIKIFIPFIEDMKSKGLSNRTINEHIDNLWMLGGSIIKDLHYYEDQRKIPPLEKIKECIDCGEGPLIHDFSEHDQRRFDATCRKLNKFLFKRNK